jgi:peptidoglycan/LPS O-acetylase OafA/YrhL
VPTETKERRVAYLDGIRGIAAQIVVVHHFILDFGPGNRKLDAVSNGYTQF